MAVLSDCINNYDKEEEVKVLGIAEITALANGL